jgi:hypothetical protein
MPYPSGTIKTVIGGTLPGGEVFAFGWQNRAVGVSTQTDLNMVNGQTNAALANNFLTTSVKALFSTQVVFTRVTNYLYTGGSSASLVSVSTPSIAGTSAVAGMPNQCAVVVTLETGVPGRSNRGRAYLPPVNVGLINAGTVQLSSATCTTLANAFASMLTALHDDSSPNGVPAVASALKGAIRDITAVRVDSIIDTQRRRRNKLVPQASIEASVS